MHSISQHLHTALLYFSKISLFYALVHPLDEVVGAATPVLPLAHCIEVTALGMMALAHLQSLEISGEGGLGDINIPLCQKSLKLLLVLDAIAYDEIPY